jgi:DnaK suppressor protein
MESVKIQEKAITQKGKAKMPKRIRMQKLRKMLMERKKRLWEELHRELFEKFGNEYRGEFERAMDAGDISSVDLLQSIGIKLMDIRQEELIKMDAAERKLNEGTYGICEECGKEISEERLAAMPYAVRCIECEERFEHTKVKGHGPTL